MTAAFHMAHTDAERYSRFGGESGSFLPSYPTPAHPGEIKTYVPENTYMLRFTAALLITLQQPKCPSRGQCGTSVNEMLLSGSHSQKHHAKGKKSDFKSYMWHDYIYVTFYDKTVRTENRSA